MCRGPESRLDQALCSAASAGSGQASGAGGGAGAPRVEEAPRGPHRERALPSAHFILNKPETWRCFPILPMRKVRF